MSEVEEMIEEVDWEKSELVPVVVQEEDGTVLTLAYMNREALRKTIDEGCAHYYSRSKERIRMKGEVSGNVQSVQKIKIDCDEDAILLTVKQEGAACHTGERTCFYRELGNEKKETEDSGGIDYSLNMMKELEQVINDRLKNPTEESYTSSLFEEGPQEIRKKVGEEAMEILVAEEKDQVIYECADLLYHMMVLLAEEDIELKEVMSELSRRRN